MNKLALFTLLLFHFSLSVMASGNGGTALQKKINVSIKHTTLPVALSILEEASAVDFAYDASALKMNNINIPAISSHQEALGTVLQKLLAGTAIQFKEEVPGTVTFYRQQGNGKIIGKISNQDGEPLPGATIRVNGRNETATSDEEGNFAIVIPAGTYTLSATYMAYSAKISDAIKVKEQTTATLNFTLEATVSALDEIVVVGYGSQRKRDLTGAVASVKGEDIAAIPSTNPIQALKGKTAGVDISNTGNEPGGNVTVLIRGQNSIGADNQPLVVMDGIPVYNGLNEINPNDVASIEILKDASATAIYGSRASNGVILITTKRGKSGRTTVNYDGYYGPTTLSHKIDLMDGQQFAQLRREAYRTIDPNGQYPKDGDIFDDIALQSLVNNTYTDWQDFAYSSGHKQNHQLSMNGGNEKTQFNTSINYYDEAGLLPNVSFIRGGYRLNLDHQFNNRLKVGVSSFANRSRQHNLTDDVYDNIVRLNPLGVPYDENGNVRFRPNNDEGQRVNPLSDIANQLNETYKTRVFASVYGEYQLADGLSYRLNVGPDLEITRTGNFFGSETTVTQGGLNRAGINNQDAFSITLENILNYRKTFAEKHQLEATLLQSFQNNSTDRSSMGVSGLPYDYQSYHNLGTAAQINSVASNYAKWLLISYMARLNYSFNSKYFLTLTARADGSSVFADGHKWGYFPSAALAWRISQEPFLQSWESLSELKLRLSYGSTGNTGIDPYKTFSFLDKTTYAFGDAGGAGFIPSSISNKDLRWETTQQFDAALDFGFLQDRFTGTVEFYNSNTHDLLLPRSIPGSTGFTTVLENIGATNNKGLEITLSGAIIQNPKGFNWSVDLNFAKNNNKITKLFGDGKDDIGNHWFIGHPIQSFFDYKKIGIWQTADAEEAAAAGFEPGQIRIEDINHDGKYNEDDRVILGSATPGWIGGLTTHFSYKGLDLSAVLQARQDYITSSSWYDNSNRLAGRYNNLDVDYWTPENPTNENPRPNINQEGVLLGSTLSYKDVSFIRFRTITLGYTFPNKWVQAMRIASLRLRLTAENPFTFTPYKGYDPEFETSGERAMYPSAKMYSLGLNATF